MRWIRWIVGILISLSVILGLTQVRPEEQAIVRRFGAIVDIWQPGLHWAIPWGVDRVDRIQVATVRNLLVGQRPLPNDPNPAVGPLLTADQNLIQAQLSIEYSIDSTPEGLLDYLRHRDQADLLVARAAESLMAEWVASQDVDSALLTGNVELPRWVMAELPSRIEPFQLGIQVQQASVNYLAPPDEVKAAFDDVNRAQTSIRTQEYRARQEADVRLRFAQSEVFRQKQLADAYQAEQLTLATAEARAFLQRVEQYHRLRAENPRILEAIWWQEMGQFLTRMKSQGRIELLDRALGPNGLDFSQVIQPPKR
ncbi:SPFH domain-containing protein [Tuwongella immobilis]|uniref:Band 7 domain-containing protein n=1 Tax=Tuwongella immobilis TaxID=692036 RepID=A0A6C2YP23_9BACT|nr:SPFH domain-containing protein [Tuwongella immobilis]VIP03144.1 Protein HflK OS=mine drainage metagenome GN=hflK PE=4 SV=1: Band_7 [Tuwongella immobilis]VTS03519.1 Protein HflK OS=mine drainage metagenome GN=hflK PE=4 SV=1: Band_7 [Tuwongella immobilis]